MGRHAADVSPTLVPLFYANQIASRQQILANTGGSQYVE